MKPLKELTRPNIWALKPYSSARDEYSGKEASVFLDANENPYNAPNNRYPDPLQRELKALLAPAKGVRPEQVFLGNGSDEAIDLMYRCFTTPGQDNVVAIEPTYGMYKVCADINDVAYRPVELDEHFQCSAERLLAACDAQTKLIWICSPNNPTGNHLDRREIEKVLTAFEGLVIIDEAYADFSSERPFRLDLDRHPNLIVLNTFSKAWGCAAIRLGMAFASADIIQLLNKVKYPYNINRLTQEAAIRLMERDYVVKRWVSSLLNERARLTAAFSQLAVCCHVYPTDANFFLAKVTDARSIYDYLVDKGIIVRNRTTVALCKDCLRITVGTRPENDSLIEALKNYPA